MAQQPFLAKVIGIPHIPTVTQVNIRSGPGTNMDLVFKVAVGTTNIPIIEVQVDNEGKNKDGKVYQWFRMQFPQGVGWLRDDLIEIWGDGTGTGYPVLHGPTQAFYLSRDTSKLAAGAEIAATGTVPTTSPEVVVTQPTTQPTTSTEVVVTQSSTTQPTTSSEVVVTQPITTQPSTTTQVVVTQPTTTQVVVTQPATTQVTTPTGPGMAMCIGKTGVNVRPGPGTNHNPTQGRMNYKDTVSVIGAQAGEDGTPLYWVKVSYQGKEVWVREDYVRLSGNFTPFSISAADKYPAPVQDTWWIRGWDPDGAYNIWPGGKHNGWDLGGVKGVTPMLAGPQGGVVYQVTFCQKCGTAGSSAPEKGFSVGDSRVWNDQGWNFGYGHFIIVGYENSKLPESTKQYLASNGKAGWNIFVMHAHMHDLMVKAGDVLSPNQQIGTLGNSGNSEGPHLHLEIRASQTMNPNGWASLKDGLMSPGVLFLR